MSIRSLLPVAVGAAVLVGACSAVPSTRVSQPTPTASLPPAGARPTASPVAQRGEARIFRIVPQQSTASYQAQEQWAWWSVPTKAVANTHDVEGELTLIMGEQPRLAANSFRVDMRTLVSEVAETPLNIPGAGALQGPIADVLASRDGVVRRRLDSDMYPFAEFTATGIEGLSASYAEGQPVKVRVSGNLTIRGEPRPVIFDTEATIQGTTLVGSATAQILMTDFGVEPPSFGGTSVEDRVTIVLQLVAAAAG